MMNFIENSTSLISGRMSKLNMGVSRTSGVQQHFLGLHAQWPRVQFSMTQSSIFRSLSRAHKLISTPDTGRCSLIFADCSITCSMSKIHLHNGMHMSRCTLSRLTLGELTVMSWSLPVDVSRPARFCSVDYTCHACVKCAYDGGDWLGRN